MTGSTERGEGKSGGEPSFSLAQREKWRERERERERERKKKEKESGQCQNEVRVPSESAFPLLLPFFALVVFFAEQYSSFS